MDAAFQRRFDKTMALFDDATPIEIGANAPAAFRWYHDGFYREMFYGGVVDTLTMELLRYRLAHEHGCAYCQLADAPAARDAGLTEAQLDRIMDEDDPGFDDRQRAVLTFAKQMALPTMDGELSPELYDRLRRHFDDGQIYHLAMCAAVLTGVAKMLFVLDLVEKTAACPVRLPRSLPQAAE
ncbi:MAG: carboxymuconolactone decarboxylase family protein [Alphaproteobacteria bacterium]|nr:carboxymuconolactone decarboxylase family protein [Alphaproteobacteria bacterium]